MFGAGGTPIGNDGNQYIMSFTLNARYFYLNKPRDKAYVNVNLGLETELTDSTATSTTTKHEPALTDLVLSTGYGHTVYQSADKQWKTTPGVSLSLVFPTSKLSMDQGKYLTAGLSANLIQEIPLAGKKSDWFPDLLVRANAGYTYQFSRCIVPCNGGAPASYARQVGQLGTPAGQDLAGIDANSDQLSGRLLTQQSMKLNLFYVLTLYKDLALANIWEIQFPFHYTAPTSSIATPTGPVTLNQSNQVLNPVTTFDLSLSYLLFDTTRIDIGYQSISPELVDNKGQRVSVFWTPAAVFYGNAVLYIDNLLDKAMSPAEKKKALGRARFSPRQN
jgi:hypothetical protein